MPDSGGLFIVMPVYNEQECIHSVLSEWLDQLRQLGVAARFAILNDGSTDNTAAALEEMARQCTEIEVIHKKNSGHGQTCVEGYLHAIQRGAEWVFQVDSDGQCNPDYFSQLWDRRQSHLAVFGRRTVREDGWARMVVSWVCRVVVCCVTGVPVRDPNVPYRLIRADVLAEVLRNFPRDFKLANILLAVILQKGLGSKVGYVDIGFRDRRGGKPSVKWTRFAAEGSTLARSLRKQKLFIQERYSALQNGRWALKPIPEKSSLLSPRN